MATSRYSWMAMAIFAAQLVSACGGGGDDEDAVEQAITLGSASRCALEVTAGQPDNCGIEAISGATYETDQVVIHLSGAAPEPEDYGCPEPGLTLGGPVCTPSVFTVSYSVSWVNETNGASGIGNVRFVASLPGPVRWRTYGEADVSNTAIGKGVPLDVGPNRITVTTNNSGLTGRVQVTVTRVVDVTPPTVFRVEPEAGETDAVRNRITVYFDEQVDPASLVGAITVTDSMMQPVAGTIEYDALRLQAIWRPNTTLDSAATYSARVTGVTDWAPNTLLAPFDWSFTTRP